MTAGNSMLNMGLSVIAMVLACVFAQGCSAPQTQAINGAPTAAGSTTASKLAGTRWRLVEIQSMDDAIGTARPSDRNLYTLDFECRWHGGLAAQLQSRPRRVEREACC